MNKRLNILTPIMGLLTSIIFVSTSIAAETIDGTGTIYNQSSYTVSLTPPVYDPNNLAHALVSNRAELDAVKSDLSKTAVFLKAGNYDLSSAVKIKGGTANTPRWFLLAGGGTSHPASLADNEQANVKLSFDGNNLRIHRLSFLDYMITRESDWSLAGWETDWAPYSNIVINECYLREFQEGIYFRAGSKDNTVQNTKFEMVWNNQSISADRMAIVLNGVEGTPMTGTKILNNEFVNCIDAVQTLSTKLKDIDYGGTIIDYNTVWFDSRATGHPELENYFDFKDGGTLENPIIVTNNVCWGLEDPNLGDAMTISLHYGARHINFSKNLFAGNGIVSMADVNLDSNLAASYITFKENVFLSTQGTTIVSFETDHNIFDNNIIKNENNSWYYTNSAGDLTKNQTIINNIIVNAAPTNKSIGVGNSVNQKNSFYGVPATDTIYSSQSSVGNKLFDTADEANLLDYMVTYDIYSGSPKTKIFKNSTTSTFGLRQPDASPMIPTDPVVTPPIEPKSGPFIMTEDGIQ